MAWKDKRFTIAMAADSALVEDAGTHEGAIKAAATRKAHGFSSSTEVRDAIGDLQPKDAHAVMKAAGYKKVSPAQQGAKLQPVHSRAGTRSNGSKETTTVWQHPSGHKVHLRTTQEVIPSNSWEYGKRAPKVLHSVRHVID